MKLTRNVLRRPIALVTALGLAITSVMPAITASAVTNQVTSRSITLSDSTADATNVTYALTMTLPDAAQSMVIDFCKDSPIIGGACSSTTALTGFSASGASCSSTNPGTGTPAGSSGPGTAPTGWSAGTFTTSTLKLTSTTATTAGTKYTFYFTGITNPSAGTSSNTFYARVYTYTDATYGSTGTAYSSPTAPGSYKDYGGFALSTANNVTITAIVMESLTFCVSKLAPGPGCGASGQAVTNPALTLGHGTPQALDTSAVDTDTAYTQLSTNALYGAVVSLKTTSSSTCSGLSRDSGVTCAIPAQGTALGNITAGAANFGLEVGSSTLATGSTSTAPGTITPTAGKYNGTGLGYYMGTTAPVTTFGDPIEASTSATQDLNNQLTYGATTSATTPAGVYTTTEALIATGTF